MEFGRPAVCPLCNYKFVLSEIYEKGDKVICKKCSGKLDIINIEPLEFKGSKSKTSNENKKVEIIEPEKV